MAKGLALQRTKQDPLVKGAQHESGLLKRTQPRIFPSRKLAGRNVYDRPALTGGRKSGFLYSPGAEDWTADMVSQLICTPAAKHNVDDDAVNIRGDSIAIEGSVESNGVVVTRLSPGSTVKGKADNPPLPRVTAAIADAFFPAVGCAPPNRDPENVKAMSTEPDRARRANPLYLNHLATQKLFEDPCFVAYLDYLQYFSKPEYISFLTYPGPTLKALQLLQLEQFRKDILNPLMVETLIQQWVVASMDFATPKGRP
ncbi:MAG: hypothetical protein M1824_005523 [Vezdaea acicularis]|nr:MAG: hypothetical protein M1824_005523 [Vezdaea acicularis]